MDQKKLEQVRKDTEEVQKLLLGGSNMKIYKGFAIEYDFYGNGEYSVQYYGDDVIFDTEADAMSFIDEVAK